jgi:uncharacterized membrane protein (Fun14 family)
MTYLIFVLIQWDVNDKCIVLNIYIIVFYYLHHYNVFNLDWIRLTSKYLPNNVIKEGEALFKLIHSDTFTLNYEEAYAVYGF